MYEVIEIIEGDMTRFIKLKNIDTGLVENCFDDSAVVSNKNFNFMKIGQRYECKIKLFGNIVFEKNENSVICKLINKSVDVGNKEMVEVQIGHSRYYIGKQSLKEYLNEESFYFFYTRKDLFQVDDVIHADYL